MSIPKTLHFCWIGPNLAWAHGFALLSAAAQGGMDEIILHHTDELADGPVLRALKDAGIICRRLVPEVLMAPVQANLGLGEALTRLYTRLSSPVQRADLLRAAILYRQGGVYMDVDTITVAPLTPLLEVPQFIGAERIVWPHWVRASRSPLVWAKHLGLDALRKALRRMPSGWRAFRAIEGWYAPAVNNAVMGGEAGAPLFAAALRAMAALPKADAHGAYALGPDLYQSLLEAAPLPGLVVHDPACFYPLGPEISEHWFRPCRNAPAGLSRLLSPQTRVAHWYGSVRTRPHVAVINPEFIRAHRQTQLYSALVAATLPGLSALM
ncbi:MAG: glycosyl transferase [Proteobacteria bacterium]|nr:glycosyl transferase [Pseudomonadota bacterium]MBU6426292.1 glycosyl transferase [Rhodospirillales bacterium]